jgi:hypothetical protein
MKRSALLAMATLLGSIHSAYSCTCIEPQGSFNERVLSMAHEAAFVGVVRIVSVKFVTEVHDGSGRYTGLREGNGLPERDEWLVAAYEPVRIWKQPAKYNYSVATGMSAAACGLPFRIGDTVLLYAYAADYSGLMHADSCGRSTLAEKATRDLDVLNRRFRIKSPRLPPN